MRLYSITPDGGTEFLIPDRRYELVMPAVYRSAPVALPAASGAWDALGVALPRAQDTLTLKFVLAASSMTALDALVQSARVATARAGIVKAVMGDGSYRRAQWRPQQVDLPMTYEHPLAVIASVRGVCGPYWQSVDLATHSSMVSPRTISNSGDADAFAGLTLTLTAQGSCTAISITNAANGYSLNWLNTASPLTAGQTITINPAAGTVVRSTGANELPYVTLGASQIGLFKLAPGSNTISYTATAGGAVLAIAWRNTWH